MLQASSIVTLGMAALALWVVACIAIGFTRAARTPAWVWRVISIVWLAVPAMLAIRGQFTSWDARPPLLMVFVVGTFVAVVAVALSRIGRDVALGTPLWALVGVQAFRLPLELVMHRAYVEGVMPQQMSYSGLNFDIVSGASALVLAIALARTRVPTVVVVIWNAMSTVLLLVIVAIAIASTPMFAAFGADRLNTWVAHFPAVWLPVILVPSALLGHVLLWRRLAHDSRGRG